jgi:hypothetical protein
MPAHGDIEVKFAMVERPRDGLTPAWAFARSSRPSTGASKHHLVCRELRPSPESMWCWAQHALDRGPMVMSRLPPDAREWP